MLAAILYHQQNLLILTSQIGLYSLILVQISTLKGLDKIELAEIFTLVKVTTCYIFIKRIYHVNGNIINYIIFDIYYLTIL